MQSISSANRSGCLLSAITLFSLTTTTADAQVSTNTGLFYSQNYSGVSGVGGQVGKYDLATTVNNPAFVLQSNPSGVSASGGNLFVATYGGGRGGSVGEYSETTGGAGTGTGGVLTGNLITGLSYPNGLLSVGTNLFVNNYLTPAGATTGSQSVSAYTVVNGVATANNKSLLTGLSGPVYQMALYSKNTLIISDPYNNPNGTGQGTVDAYTLSNLGTSNVTATPAYSFGFAFATGVALYGNNLFVCDPDGVVGEYNASTGAAINSMFLTGLGNSYSLAVSGNYLIVDDYANSATGTITRFDLTAANPASSATVLINNAYEVFSITTDNPVPEPTAIGILGGGSILLGRRRRARPLTTA